MLRKAMLMATMVAAVAAFVAPSAQASFSNSKWSMGGVELKVEGTFEGTGQLKFTSTAGLGGIECHVVAHANLIKESSTGSITKFVVSNCMYFGPLLLFCETNVDVNATLPWTIHAQKTGSSKRILITKPVIHTEVTEPGANCPNGGKINVEGSDSANPVFATPDSNTAATKLTFGGEVATTIGAAKVEGTITLTSGSGTYGIL